MREHENKHSRELDVAEMMAGKHIRTRRNCMTLPGTAEVSRITSLMTFPQTLQQQSLQPAGQHNLRKTYQRFSPSTINSQYPLGNEAVHCLGTEVLWPSPRLYYPSQLFLDTGHW